MVYQRVSKPYSGNSQIRKKKRFSLDNPTIPVQAQSVSASPQEQEMPSYTPLAANWVTNNNLMRSMSGAQVVQRQEESGNKEMKPIQAKLTIGQVGDRYEREADQTAQQVVNQINAPAPEQSAQGQSLQREEMPEEDELQMKSETDVIQREEMPEEDELQMKPMVQRKSDEGGMAATSDLEASIQQAKGGGQPLADKIREPMEQAFGADFSGVNVHTDTHSDQLNQSIQAKAFTTGQDVFFRQGAYDPGSRGGQELLAHELTHVVQQTGGGQAIQRSILDEFKIESQATQADENAFLGREQKANSAQSQAGTLIDIPDNINSEISGTPLIGASKGNLTSPLDTSIDEATETRLQQPTKPDNDGGKWPGFKYKELVALGKSYQSEQVPNDKADAKLFGYEFDKRSTKAGPYSEAVGGTVKHVQDNERKQYELTSEAETKGDMEGETNTVFYWRGKPMETTEMAKLALTGAGGRAIFVMTADGKIYAADPAEEVKKSEQLWQQGMSFDRFHHSSFLRGAPVAAAGELVFEEGILKTISNQSGHYRPGIVHIMQVLQEFKERGVVLAGVQLELFMVTEDQEGTVTFDAAQALETGARNQEELIEAIEGDRLAIVHDGLHEKKQTEES